MQPALADWTSIDSFQGQRVQVKLRRVFQDFSSQFRFGQMISFKIHQPDFSRVDDSQIHDTLYDDEFSTRIRRNDRRESDRLSRQFRHPEAGREGHFAIYSLHVGQNFSTDFGTPK